MSLKLWPHLSENFDLTCVFMLGTKNLASPYHFEPQDL
jgi:hypothetical protein